MKRITLSMLAVAAAMLASGQPAMAASCNGNGHQIVLSNGSATPGAGTTSTSIRFSVRYADTAGCAPSRVVVVVQGVGTYPLNGSGSDYTGRRHLLSYAESPGRQPCLLVQGDERQEGRRPLGRPAHRR